MVAEMLSKELVEEVERALRDVPVEKALFEVRPCELYTYHQPLPVMTEGHHHHPVYLQNRLFGRIVDNELVWLCSNCHDAVHAWIYWRMGDRRVRPRVGYKAMAEAERTLKWYVDNGGPEPVQR
jgi:hypothetical protein